MTSRVVSASTTMSSAIEREPNDAEGAPVPEALLFPYLPITEPVHFGPWELIPGASIPESEAIAPWISSMLPQLMELYRSPDADWNAVGCIAKLRTEPVGTPVDPALYRPLHRAVAAALLDGNPDGPSETREGWAVATSDNALMYGHRIGPDGYIAVRYGAMVQALVGGLQVGTEHSQIRPPSELHIPFMHPPLDDVYAAGLLEELSKGTDDARRLGGAIDWLDIAWRNTVSIDEDTRIVALRAGFEVLLNAGDTTSAIRDALCSLLDSADAKKITRTWTTPSGSSKSAELSDFGWWFQRFSFLRNKLMHGEQPAEEDYLHNEERHLWLGEARLRQAIKRAVANAGHPTVLQSPLERAFSDVADKLGLGAAPPTGEGDAT
jgi:hypothetical protein